MNKYMCHSNPWPLIKIYVSISQNDKLINLNLLKNHEL
jgi:hypothetical protein